MKKPHSCMSNALAQTGGMGWAAGTKGAMSPTSGGRTVAEQVAVTVWTALGL